MGNLPAATRAALSRLARTDATLELVGPAATTATLPLLARRWHPEVVVLSEDQFDGLAELRQVLPVPVLLCASRPSLPGRLRVVRALGVYDYLPPMPEGGPELLDWFRQVRGKLLAARQNGTVARYEARRLPALPLPPRGIVVIGGSTGGGLAVEALLRGLPANFPWAVVVAVHLPRQFTASLTARLSRATVLPVAAAASGTRLQAGQVLVAPGGHNLVVRPVSTGPWLGWRTDFVPSTGADVPSVDVLMQSAAGLAGRHVLGIILTGLGCDGTAGARAIRAQGGTIVAQDEASSAVFSMPASVIQAGQANVVLPLAGMAEFMTRHAQRSAAPPSVLLPSRFQTMTTR